MVSFPNVSKICLPAKIYLAFSAVSIILGILMNIGSFTIFFKILFVALWTWLLNLLCVKGFELISWILVILPFIIILGAAASVVENSGFIGVKI